VIQKQFIHNLKHLHSLNREDTEGGRFYVLPDGKRVPSVTTVLGFFKKDSLKAWREKVGEEEANRISKKASTRGTKLHAVCEDYVGNKPIDFKNLDIGTLDLFSSIVDILDETIDDVHGIETPLYSQHLGIAGTVDLVARFKGKRSIIDYKTSNKPKKREWIEDYFMQCACYAVMFEELTGIPVPQIVIIIAIDNDYPQVFVEKRDDWIDKAISVINTFYDYHGLTHGKINRQEV
jgi:genome maintenance exonuclease 1